MGKYKNGTPPPEWYEKRFADIDEIRPLVLKLEKHYGGLSLASDATGIPYRTLQGIRMEGKTLRVANRTAESIREAYRNPPPPPPPRETLVDSEVVRPEVLSLIKHYGGLEQAARSMGMSESTLRGVKDDKRHRIYALTAERIRKAYRNPPPVVDPTMVPIERVRPLVLFLIKAYGGVVQTGRAVGISKNTIGEIKLEKKPYVTRNTAIALVKAVQALRHGDRTWSVYENEGPPRLASLEDASRAKVRYDK